MQPIGQSVRSLWKPQLIPDAMSSLRDLHLCGLVHGDPRLENLLFCLFTTPHYVWADLVGLTSTDPASRLNYREDMAALVKSILRHDLSEEMKTLLEQYEPENETSLKVLIAFVVENPF